MPHRVSRRSALSALLATPLAVSAAMAQAPAVAPPPGRAPLGRLRFREVVVDATRVAALGNPAGADRLTIVLGHELARLFADRIAPAASDGSTLVVRISSLYLTSYTGGRAYGRGGAGGGSDSLDGAAIVTAGGRAVAQIPILAVLDPSYSGAWYLPNIDELRIESISHQFAWWLRREMDL